MEETKNFFRCPDCGKKLARIGKGAKATSIYIWCGRCKKEHQLHINEPKKQEPFLTE